MLGPLDLDDVDGIVVLLTKAKTVQLEGGRSVVETGEQLRFSALMYQQ